MRKSRGRPRHNDLLTPAEWRTVNAVRHGMTNTEIAKGRHISLDAVKYHVRNSVQKLGLENRKELRVWKGSPKDSALKLGQNGGRTEMGISGIGQISRSVRNVEQSQAWYRDILGLTHLYTYGTMAFFDCGGTRLLLNQSNEPNSDSLLYLQVADIDATHNMLEQRDVEFLNAPHMIHRHDDGTEEWMAFFNDLEGRPLAIMASVSCPASV